ncbi:MAG: hypothetical protein V4544_07555 [Pseudomonadota bacterium]
MIPNHLGQLVVFCTLAALISVFCILMYKVYIHASTLDRLALIPNHFEHIR